MPVSILDLRTVAKADIANDPDPGMGLFSDQGNLFVGPWQWRADENAWDAPDSVATGYVGLGSDPLARMRVAARNGMADLLGLNRASLPDSNLADILAHFILGTLADPRGLTSVKPLRMRRDGLRLYLGEFGLVLSEPLSTNHPNFDATLAVRLADYRRNRAAGVPLEALQRWTGHDARKLFRRTPTANDLDRLLPPEFRDDGERPPQTVFTESFNTANSGTLGPDLTWAQAAGTWSVSGNKATVSDTGSVPSARAEHDLSSDDHYSEVDDTGSGTDPDIQRGCSVRCNPADEEHYEIFVRNNISTSVRIRRVSSTGSVTNLASVSSLATAPGVVIKLEVDGSSLEGFIDGVSVIGPTTDTTFTGYLRAGLAAQASAGGVPFLDSFVASDLVAPVVVTPTTLALTINEFGPSVATPRLVTTGTLAATLATFAPSIAVPVMVTPGVVTLTISEFAPDVVLATIVTPSLVGLTTGEFASQVVLGNVLSPTTVALSVAIFAPTAINPVTVTPGVQTLTITEFAPTISTPVVETPGTLNLTITTFAPTTDASVEITPATGSLSIIDLVPTVATPVLATPPTLVLDTLEFAPSVATPVQVTVPASSLTIAVFAPTVETPVIATPTTTAMTTTSFTPLVSIAINPGAAALSLSQFAPLVVTPSVATPPPADLPLTVFAPIATGGQGVTRIPASATVILTEFAPTITAPATLTPDTGTLTLNNFAPSVALPVVATPASNVLSLAIFIPDIVAPVTGTPATANLSLTILAPTVSTPIVATPDAMGLGINALGAEVTAEAHVTSIPITVVLILAAFVPTISTTVIGLIALTGPQRSTNLTARR